MHDVHSVRNQSPFEHRYPLVRTPSDQAAMTRKLHPIDLLAVISALFFIVSTAVGSILWFSPVPFWDMWDGTVDFHFLQRTGGIRTFFERANEHRILWSRILFWADYKFFGGLSHLLIAANFALMVALWAAFASSAIRLSEDNRRAGWLAALIVALPCFSWLQTENINWGYQSQFFLAYLLPLLALLSMARWMCDGRERWYYASIALGVASSLSMANGLLALPLLVAMLLLNQRFDIRRLVGSIMVTFLTIGIWMIGYESERHPVQPLEWLKFFVAFLGAPGHWIFQNEVLTLVLGVSLLLTLAYFGFAWVAGRTRNPYYSALLLFLLYVVAAAAAAATGRGFGGYLAALASRYETPVMLAYAAIVVMAMHLGRRNQAGTRASLATLLGAFIVIFLPTQLQAIGDAGRTRSQERMLAALALDLSVRDNDAISAIFPVDTPDRVERVQRIAHKAVSEGLGIFSQKELSTARAALGAAAATTNLKPCTGFLDAVLPIPTDEKHLKIQGWTFNAQTDKVPPVAFIVSAGKITGVGLTGIDRPDVQKVISPNALRSGFSGYALAPMTAGAQFYCPTEARLSP